MSTYSYNNGFAGDSLLMDGLHQSTLESLFDSDCIDRILLLVNNSISFSYPQPLNEEYTITLLLGLYGSLTISIRFLVTYTFKLYRAFGK